MASFFRTPELEIAFRTHLRYLLFSTLKLQIAKLEKDIRGYHSSAISGSPQVTATSDITDAQKITKDALKFMKSLFEERILFFYDKLLGIHSLQSAEPRPEVKFPVGIEDVLSFYYQQSRKKGIKAASKFDDYLELLVAGKVEIFNKILLNYADPRLLSLAMRSPEPETFINEQTRQEFSNDSICEELESMSIVFDKRKILKERSLAILLKRLDTLAIFLCPSKLTVCVAATFYKDQGLVISANMNEQALEPALTEVLSSRLKLIQRWCRQALSNPRLAILSKEERLELILSKIILYTEYKEAIADGIAIEPPVPYIITNTSAHTYFKTQLAKVINTFCFDENFKKQGELLLLQPVILLPTDRVIRELFSHSPHMIHKLFNQEITNPLRNIHAEQILIFYGGKSGPKRNTIHPIGISKLCCADCARVAQEYCIMTAGTSEGKFPGTVNLADITQRHDGAGQVFTAAPAEDEGYLTPNPEAQEFDAQRFVSGSQRPFSLVRPSEETRARLFMRRAQSAPPPLAAMFTVDTPRRDLRNDGDTPYRPSPASSSNDQTPKPTPTRWWARGSFPTPLRPSMSEDDSAEAFECSVTSTPASACAK